MKKVMLTTIVLTAIAGFVRAQEAAPIKHKFLAVDYWKGKIHFVDENDTSKNWSEPWGGGLRDLQLVGNHQLLVSEANGWKIYDLESHKKVAEIKLEGVSGIATLRRCPDGRTFVGINQKANGKECVAVCELDAGNKLVRKVDFPQFRWIRMLRRTPQGTWLIAEWDGAAEVTLAEGVADDKRVLNRFKLPRPRNAYMALRKPDGNVLVAGGYAAGLFEYKSDGTFLRELVVKQPDGMKNHFYAGLQILGNGHVIQSNWNGHSDKDYNPGWKLFEFDQDGKVVWTWHELPEKVGTINSLLVLDGLDTGVYHDDVSGILAPAKPAAHKE